MTTKEEKMVLFHGGCLGCVQQKEKGLEYCYDCCYFEADWGPLKDNLYFNPYSDQHRAEKKRLAVKRLKRIKASRELREKEQQQQRIEELQKSAEFVFRSDAP